MTIICVLNQADSMEQAVIEQAMIPQRIHVVQSTLTQKMVLALFVRNLNCMKIESFSMKCIYIPNESNDIFHMLF